LTTTHNLLLAQLPAPERAQLLSLCERVPLTLGSVLSERGERLHHVHFPEDGFVSLLAQVDAHPSLEVGMVGREGMLGVSLLLGVALAPVRSLVQGEGTAWRLEADALARLMSESALLRLHLHGYLYVLMAQMVGTAGCLRFHLIGPRLARWLLMSQDRAHADHFHVTHQFLSHMLGTRRVGVTVAAGLLQQAGLIRYHRGELTVLNRTGLEAAACACYAADRHIYDTQMA
jgi:CRP-like cAMP-binding protein